MLDLARTSKDERMESCYDLFEKYNWDLTKFKNDTDLFIEDVRKNAREYIENVSKKPMTKEQVWCLMPRNIRTLFTEYDAIMKEMLQEKIIDRSQLMDIDWMINNLKNNISKFCYDICEELKWINANIDVYCNERNILPISVNSLAKYYMSDVLKMDEEQQEKHWAKRLSYRKDYNLNETMNVNSIYCNLFNELLDTTDYQDVINVFQNFNKQYSVIKTGLIGFMMSYNIPMNQREDIFNKLNLYFDYLKENRKLDQEAKRTEKANQYVEENLDNARTIINGYIDGKYDDINKYCLDTNMEKRLFDKYLEVIKNNDESLYTKYLQHIESNKNKVYEDLMSRSLIVINLIKNGVIENDTKRDFDISDYYKYLPIGFERMLRIVRPGLTNDDYKLLCSYVGQYKNERELSEEEINNIYDMKTIANVQFDESNKVIPGSGREITIEEKQNIVKYLNNNNIPVTNKTYNVIYRRWLSGNLVVDNEKDKTK